MKLYQLISLLQCMLILSCTTYESMKPYDFSKAKKVILKEEGVTQFFYWELDDASSLWSEELGEVSGIYKYRSALTRALGTNGLNQAVLKEATQNMPKSVLTGVENGDRINALLVHTGTLGNVRKINFLEAQILNYQIKRYPLLSHPTEFHGFIALHEKDKKVRVYFGASDQGWPPRPNILIEQLEKDIEVCWKLKYHLHNHYCNEEDNYLGILAPSLADAQYFKMLKERFNVSKALVTNGFHTVEIDQTEFATFESH